MSRSWFCYLLIDNSVERGLSWNIFRYSELLSRMSRIIELQGSRCGSVRSGLPCHRELDTGYICLEIYKRDVLMIFSVSQPCADV